MNQFLTIDGFEKLSKQELFDMSVAHIGQTREKSMNDGACSYQGSGCAAAPFLKPECREAADNSCHSPSWDWLADLGIVPSHCRNLVTDLQCCHDHSQSGVDFMKQWYRRMTELAGKEGLNRDKLDAIKL